MSSIPSNRNLSRRSLLNFLGIGTLATSLGLDLLQKRPAEAATLSADAALKQLMAGNQRYTAGQSISPDRGLERITSLAQSQAPVAVILGCADSRVPPEVIFDQGLGSLFTIRVAGNIVDDANLGSIEYAVESLNVKLVVVLGHERCGAVTAALNALTTGTHLPGHLEALTKAIEPAIVQAQAEQSDNNLLDRAVRANIRSVVRTLSSSQPLLARRVAQKKLKIVGGHYDLDSGAVEMIT
ncbi:carbonic anhydrase [Altericista sp. CCNU0014]|uniref:carbonic anhydrase n=1 Tax=Altericista sp. CCNU0014 TaxID=3082949 RepID=UPI00384F064B